MSYSFKFMAKKDKKKEEVKEVKKEEEKKLPPSQQLKKVATEHYKNIDKVLEKVEPVVYIAKKYEFSRLSVTLILIGMLVGVILICLNIKGAFITDIIAYIYPAYKTIKSIDIAEKYCFTIADCREKDKHFPKQWLSYWYLKWTDNRLMFGFYKLMENFNEHLLKVFPFY
ncbi:hypothetical protein BC833DRAFT_576011 [Globomyces pollinis-pini]|nr:hypothetical protein BC833DRAFT_576011 [Globomyces pollinis-pini]